jgi:hypothetical protein
MPALIFSTSPIIYSTVNLIAAQAREKGVTAVMMGGDGWDFLISIGRLSMVGISQPLFG